MIRHILAGAALAGTLTGMTLLAGVASAPPAHATAIGCSKFSETPYLGIPTGVLCFNVFGSGENITSMDANWTVVGALCNWRIDWVIYKDGKTWWRDNGPREGCLNGQAGRKRGAGRAPDGSDICAELYDVPRNVKIDAVCHSIAR
jgi:hypothetical protein